MEMFQNSYLVMEIPIKLLDYEINYVQLLQYSAAVKSSSSKF